jgi:hypothetical protein
MARFIAFALRRGAAWLGLAWLGVALRLNDLWGKWADRLKGVAVRCWLRIKAKLSS